jgi:DNA polymerase/3'-5' exonuclease PolX
LRFVHGIGEKNAEKMAKEGITLELLMDDWNNYIKKNPDNSILMFSKMPIPAGYGKKQWELMDEGRQRGILSTELERKLKQETKFLHKLTTQQLLGLKYFHDMSQKIPREEVQKVETILKKVAQRMNPDIKLMLCGSYRRGRPRSGDIDCLITHPDIKTKEDLELAQTNILIKFVKVLTDVKFIVDHLTDFGKSKYMGFCIINQQGKKINNARRIDIKFIPYNSFGAAILYFTGSKNFNTIMRGYAKNKGYMLNEYGLVRQSDGVLISCPEEMDAFTILGYPYKKPEDRDI